MRPLVSIAVAVALLAGCSDPLELSVDLRTDLRPGVEIDQVYVRWEGGGRELGSQTVPAGAGRDFVRGERLVDVAGLAPGPHRVEVVALLAGAEVASRATVIELVDDLALTVVITRDCAATSCTAGNLTECVDGQCVEPACRPGAPEACPAASCAVGEDCPAPAVACLRAECAALRCLEVVDDALCGLGERCDPTRGCVGDAPPVDGGARDASVPRDGAACATSETACTDGLDDDCDLATDCADAECAGAACDDGDPCTHTDVCTAGACAGTAVTCASDDCVTRACNGSPTCDETPLADGTACTDDGNACTTDTCTAGRCRHASRPNGTTVSGWVHCCGGNPVDFSTNRSHCGGCGLGCASGYDCTIYDGHPTCDCGAANSQCQGGSGWVCSNVYGVCACLASGCPAGSTCISRTGPDYCEY